MASTAVKAKKRAKDDAASSSRRQQFRRVVSRDARPQVMHLHSFFDQHIKQSDIG